MSSNTLDLVLREGGDSLSILFPWSRDCPNCDMAKRAMLLAQSRLQRPLVRWLHDNVCDDPAMTTRLGLHGVPVFFVFHRERKLLRISAWPGVQRSPRQSRSRSRSRLRACRKPEQRSTCTLNSHDAIHTKHVYRRDGDQKWHSTTCH